ncbi:hypothetical protein AAFF_G00157540 [Aldrovandia affinis]|uniref:Uncharacterized protein n=1 Tax=Aldrovandia affinis TaxID=143900 RepID=A0AAD7RNI7_9TELE|nr:hypothetical protein AAFF_G00157540 [Aldrovandia affinis]
MCLSGGQDQLFCLGHVRPALDLCTGPIRISLKTQDEGAAVRILNTWAPPRSLVSTATITSQAPPRTPWPRSLCPAVGAMDEVRLPPLIEEGLDPADSEHEKDLSFAATLIIQPSDIDEPHLWAALTELSQILQEDHASSSLLTLSHGPDAVALTHTDMF